jgi:hypothetical protein
LASIWPTAIVGSGTMAIVSEHGVGRSVFPVKASLARPDNLESPRDWKRS